MHRKLVNMWKHLCGCILIASVFPANAVEFAISSFTPEKELNKLICDEVDSKLTKCSFSLENNKNVKGFDEVATLKLMADESFSSFLIGEMRRMFTKRKLPIEIQKQILGVFSTDGSCYELGDAPMAVCQSITSNPTFLVLVGENTVLLFNRKSEK